MTDKIKLKDMTQEQRSEFFRNIGAKGGAAKHTEPYHFEKIKGTDKHTEYSKKGGSLSRKKKSNGQSDK